MPFSYCARLYRWQRLEQILTRRGRSQIIRALLERDRPASCSSHVLLTFDSANENDSFAVVGKLLAPDDE